MRLHRFYISEAIGNKKDVVIESAEQVNQIRHVFRLKNGERVVLFDGSGSDYECEIIGGEKSSLNLRTVSTGRSHYMPTRKIYLCAAIVKKDNFEFIVEKATELGVTNIIPIVAERTEKKSLNESRLRKIALEASEQSGRGDVPAIHEVVSLKQCVENLKSADNTEFENLESLAFHTEGQRFEKDELVEGMSIAVFAGPEGGWSPDEIDRFHKNEVLVRCLGNQVLRSETAVISALSQVVFEPN